MAIKIGTINKSKEIKMPNGTWKYVGNKGIGHPIAQQLLKEGYEVVQHIKGEEKETTLDAKGGRLMECEDGTVYRMRKINNRGVVEMIKPSKE